MADDLFREGGRPDISFVGSGEGVDYFMSAIHELWECRRCFALVRNRAGHITWHRAVDSTSTAVVGTPSERAKQ